LVGCDTDDDSGDVLLDTRRPLALTLGFFTPIAADPHAYRS